MPKLCDLTGLPMLHEMYSASARSHYSQVDNMLSMGWLEGTVKRYSRDPARLIYCAQNQIRTGLVSPLQCLLSHVNATGRSKLHFDSESSWLVRFEEELEGNSDVRILQKILTLAHLGKLAETKKRGRFTSHETRLLKESEGDVVSYLRKCKRSRVCSEIPLPDALLRPCERVSYTNH